jgi:hypothetical protein
MRFKKTAVAVSAAFVLTGMAAGAVPAAAADSWDGCTQQTVKSNDAEIDAYLQPTRDRISTLIATLGADDQVVQLCLWVDEKTGEVRSNVRNLARQFLDPRLADAIERLLDRIPPP